MFTSQDIPQLPACEVVVCGGGPAGCAAAVASARNGARTLLVEKYGFLGGAPVTQLVSVVLSTNAVDFQGIWHEWARRLLAIGAMAPLLRAPSRFNPECRWFRTSVDAEGVKVVWDDMVEEAGAETLLLAHACGAWIEDGRMVGVVLHTRAGLRRVRAERVIDTTGDAAICHEAGVAWDRGVVGKLWPQRVALNCRFGGYPVPGSAGGARLGDGGTLAYRPERRDWVQLPRVDPLDPLAVAAAMRQARREIQRKAAEAPPGRYLVDTASELGVRTSRLVQGIARVSDDDALQLRKADDGIARSSWEIDIHPPDEDPAPAGSLKSPRSGSEAYIHFARRLTAGDWFDIPYGCLVAAGMDHLLVAGRCVSSGYLAQASLRIQQTCMSTGQAAGTAAAMSLQAGIKPRLLDPASVVERLRQDRDVEPVPLPD